MSIIRVAKKHNPFVQIDKTCLEDRRLSWKAKGLLAYLLSRPDNWNLQINHIVQQSTDGRDAVYSAINELRTYGYCYRSPEKVKNESGKFTGYEYTVYEIPEPYTGFPDMEKPDMENPYVNNKDSNKNELKFEEEEATAELSQLYTQNLGMITPIAAEWIREAVEEYPKEWYRPAFEEAVKNNARTWNYISAILKRWKAKGFRNDDRPKKKTKERDYDKAGDDFLALVEARDES